MSNLKKQNFLKFCKVIVNLNVYLFCFFMQQFILLFYSGNFLGSFSELPSPFPAACSAYQRPLPSPVASTAATASTFNPTIAPAGAAVVSSRASIWAWL